MATSFTTWIDPPADDTIIAPLIGGVFKDTEDKITAWSGFDPDQPTLCFSYKRISTLAANVNDPPTISETWIVDTIKNDKHLTWVKNKGPLHPGQFRPIGIKCEQKTREHCTTHSGVKFHGIEAKNTEPRMALSTYKTSLRQHMIINGMFDVFLLPDAITPTVKYDLFQNHSRSTMDQVRLFWEKAVADGITDKYINENLQNSGTYIRSTISPVLLQSLYNDIDPNANGPVTLIALLRIIYSDGYDAIEATKADLKSIDLKKFSGENVVECSTKILDLCERLDTAEAFSQDLLCVIARIFELSSERRFSDWAMKKYHGCSNQVKETRFHPDLVIYRSNLPNPNTFITYQSLCAEAKQEYRDLVASNRYKGHNPRELTMLLLS